MACVEGAPKLKVGLESPIAAGAEDGVEDCGAKENNGLDVTSLFASEGVEDVVGGPKVRGGLAVGTVAAGDDVAVCVRVGNIDVVDGCVVVAEAAVADLAAGFVKKLGIDPALVSDAGFPNGEGVAKAAIAGFADSEGATGVSDAGFVNNEGVAEVSDTGFPNSERAAGVVVFVSWMTVVTAAGVEVDLIS